MVYNFIILSLFWLVITELSGSDLPGCVLGGLTDIHSGKTKRQ
jgi:hypothetical protein